MPGVAFSRFVLIAAIPTSARLALPVWRSLVRPLVAGDSPKQITQPQALLCTARLGESWGIPWRPLGHSMAPVGRSMAPMWHLPPLQRLIPRRSCSEARRCHAHETMAMKRKLMQLEAGNIAQFASKSCPLRREFSKQLLYRRVFPGHTVASTSRPMMDNLYIF